jgi:hypothetical protein
MELIFQNFIRRVPARAAKSVLRPPRSLLPRCLFLLLLLFKEQEIIASEKWDMIPTKVSSAPLSIFIIIQKIRNFCNSKKSIICVSE